MTGDPWRALRVLAGSLAVMDLVLVGLVERRSRLASAFLGPKDHDLSVWCEGEIAAYVLAQASIAARPSAEGARRLAVMRAVLVPGDLGVALRRDRAAANVRPWTGVLTALVNSIVAVLALTAGRVGGAGTREQTHGGSLPERGAMV